MRKILPANKNAITLLVVFLFVFVLFATVNAEETKCSVIALKNQYFFPALLKAIDEAQSEIYISMFSFRTGVHKRSCPDRILMHLSRAVKRGVVVKVILENTGSADNELDVQNLKTKKALEKQGINVFLDSPQKTTHTKLIIIDQRLVILGSHNLTQSAMKYNNEISLLVESPDLAYEIRNYMLAIIKEAK